MNTHILIVEDEERLAHLMGDYLKQEGFQVHYLYTGDAVIDRVKAGAVDLILLDTLLPGRDGLSILKELRGFSDLPVIMVTARTEEIDRLLGLEAGADDYVCKPFSFREVVARVKAVLRRSGAGPSSHGEGGLILDPRTSSARLNDQSVPLTVIEFKLLQALAARPGHILSRDRLMDLIYPDGRIVSDRTIDSHIRKLRAKLSPLHPGQHLIHSVYSAGYKLELLPMESM
ncbi:MAG: response regulator [Desulfobacterales bacterium]|nr:response regulator [Desulfobacterales bacterium]